MATITTITKDGDLYIETGSQKVFRAHNIFQVLGAFVAQDPVFSRAASEAWKIEDGKEQCFRVWRCSYRRETAKAPVCPRNVTFIREVC